MALSLLQLTQLATPIWPKQEFKSFYGNLKFFPPLDRYLNIKCSKLLLYQQLLLLQDNNFGLLHCSIVFISGRYLLPLADRGKVLIYVEKKLLSHLMVSCRALNKAVEKRKEEKQEKSDRLTQKPAGLVN